VPAAYGSIQYRWGWARRSRSRSTTRAPIQGAPGGCARGTGSSPTIGPAREERRQGAHGTVRCREPEQVLRGGAPPGFRGPSHRSISRARRSRRAPRPARVERRVSRSSHERAAPPGTEVIRRARLYAGPVHYETLVRAGSRAGPTREPRLALDHRALGAPPLVAQRASQGHPELRDRDHPPLDRDEARLLPLTQSSLRAMKLMHHLQPQVKAIQTSNQGRPSG
jgi:hypothetical protein